MQLLGQGRGGAGSFGLIGGGLAAGTVAAPAELRGGQGGAGVVGGLDGVGVGDADDGDGVGVLRQAGVELGGQLGGGALPFAFQDDQADAEFDLDIGNGAGAAPFLFGGQAVAPQFLGQQRVDYFLSGITGAGITGAGSSGGAFSALGSHSGLIIAKAPGFGGRGLSGWLTAGLRAGLQAGGLLR